MATDEARLAELAHPESEMASLPWAVMTVDEFSHDGWGATRRFIQFDGQPALESIAEVWFGATEAEYIALAANLAPALLAERDALLAQSAALRDQLAALVAVDPIVRYGSGDYVCHFCYAEHHNRRVHHADNCPWQMAQGLAARTPTPGAAGEVG